MPALSYRTWFLHGTLAAFLLAAGWFIGTHLEAAAPTFTGGAPSDGATEVATSASVTAVSDTALSPISLVTTGWQNYLAIAAFQDVRMLNATTGYAVGGDGHIEYTTDRGATWVVRGTGTSNMLRSITFVDGTTGWVAGSGGTILKTTDGGVTWSTQTSGTSAQLNDITALDTSTVFAVSATGLVLRTTDGGVTWTSQSVTSTALYAIAFANTTTGWAVGFDPDGLATQVIRKTTDGGTTWATQTATLSQSLGIFSDIVVIDANTAWVIGATSGDGGAGLRDGIWKTTNGGTTWTEQTSSQPVFLYAAYRPTATVAYAVGAPGHIILKTTDNGSTWATVTSPGSSVDLNSVWATDANTVIAVASGVVVTSVNGGTSWTKVGGAPGMTVYALASPQTNVGVAVGSSGGIERSTDGGQTWTSISSGVYGALYDVNFSTGLIGYAVGDSGTVLKTTNGGTSWTSVTSGTTTRLLGVAVKGADGATVYVIGQNDTVRKTTDGGTTWSAIPTGENRNYFDLYFDDANTGWIAGGSSRIFKTTNGGTNWTGQNDVADPQLNAVDFLDTSTAWAVGRSGTILKTTNGGTNWTAQTSGSSVHLEDVDALDANTVWAVGSGTVLRTTNGGTSWTSATPTTNSLYALKIFDATTGWAAGDSQTFLVQQPNVTLQLNTGNTSGGTPIAPNLCSAVTLASGTTITCSHATLAPAAWYTLTIPAGGSGVKASDETALATAVTRVFQTAGAGAPPVAADTAAPGAPSGLATAGGNREVALTWTDPLDTDLVSLRVLRRVGEASVLRATVAPGLGRYTDRGDDVVPGTTYTYEVQAVDVSGNTATSASVTVTVTDAPAVPAATSPGTSTVLPEAPVVTGGERVTIRFRLERIFGVDRIAALTTTELDTLVGYLGVGIGAATRLPESGREDLLIAFRDVYQLVPRTPIDYRILAAMVLKPDGTFVEDVITLRRNIALERRHIGTFGSVNGRLPGQGVATVEEVDADWKALRILTYGHVPTMVDQELERAILRAFLARDLDIATESGSTRKRSGVGPQNPVDRRIIRACAYGNPERCGLVEEE